MTTKIDTGIGSLELKDSEAEEFPPGFFEWLTENEPVYEGFVGIAKEGYRLGLRKWGAFAVINILRWRTALREVKGQYKINNNRAPALARLAMKQFPELIGFFSTREISK